MRISPRKPTPFHGNIGTLLSIESEENNYGESGSVFNTFGLSGDKTSGLMSNGFAPYSQSAFPGHPGYIGAGDHPRGIPGTSAHPYTRGKDSAAREDAGSQEAIPVRTYGANDAESWGDTIGRRASASPRFLEAVRRVNSESPGEFRRISQTLDHSVPPLPPEGQTYSQQWNAANADAAAVYWKAHQMTQHLTDVPDPFEDATALRDRRPRVNEKLSSQFKLVPGFIK